MLNMQSELERVAKIFYERSGKVEGRDLDNWLLAKRYMSVWHGQKKSEEQTVVADRRRVSVAVAKDRRQNAAMAY
jgi:hypothetical protein